MFMSLIEILLPFNLLYVSQELGIIRKLHIIIDVDVLVRSFYSLFITIW